MKINMTLLAITGLALVIIIPIFQAFTVWQLDMLFVARMWGPCQVSIQFYSDLLGNGYASYSQMPWSINIWLFPNMVAGQAYDLLMILNLSCPFFVAAGGFMIAKSLTVYKNAVRKLYKNLRTRDKT